MVSGGLNFAVPLVFLLLGALGLALTAAYGRVRRGPREQPAAEAAALPESELGPAEALRRAWRLSVRTRRLGWLFAIAVTLLALTFEDPGDGETYFVFGCGYLAAVAVGEALMPKPEPGRVQSAVLDPRRPGDYVPRRLLGALHAGVGLGICLCAATVCFDSLVHVTHVDCARALGTPVEELVYPDTSSLPYALVLTAGYAAIWLATRGVLGQIAHRARPSGHPALISVDDALRRASAVRVCAAGLGATLLTMPIPLNWIDRSVVSPCWNAPQTADSILRYLMLGCAVAGLAALVVAPGGGSRAHTGLPRPAQAGTDTDPGTETNSHTNEGA